MATKIWLGTALMLVILTASFYVLMPGKVRIDFEKTRTVFKVYEDGKFVISGIEYVRLFDGTKLMRASGRTISHDILDTKTIAKRESLFKDGIVIDDLYEFDNEVIDVESVPVLHKTCFTNAKGKIFEYMIDKIEYGGETRGITSPFSFGKNMKLTFQDGYYKAGVYNYKYASDKIKIRYRVTEDYQCFDTKLFDPIEVVQLDKDDYLEFLPDMYKGECTLLERCRACFNMTLTGEVICAESSVEMGKKVDVIPNIVCNENDCDIDFSIVDIQTQKLDYSLYTNSFRKTKPSIREVSVFDKYVFENDNETFYNNISKKEEIKETIIQVPTYKLINETFYDVTQDKIITNPTIEYSYPEWIWWEGLGTVELLETFDVDNYLDKTIWINDSSSPLSISGGVVTANACWEGIISNKSYGVSNDWLVIFTVSTGVRTYFGIHDDVTNHDNSDCNNNVDMDGQIMLYDTTKPYWYWLAGSDAEFQPVAAVQDEIRTYAFHITEASKVEAYMNTSAGGAGYELVHNGTGGTDLWRIAWYVGQTTTANSRLYNITLINLTGEVVLVSTYFLSGNVTDGDDNLISDAVVFALVNNTGDTISYNATTDVNGIWNISDLDSNETAYTVCAYSPKNSTTLRGDCVPGVYPAFQEET